MSHQVIWTKRVLDFFCEAANLTPFEREVMVTRLTMTRLQQAEYLSVSLSTLDKCIARLKRKYDEVQNEFPNELKPRKASAAETYMDEH